MPRRRRLQAEHLHRGRHASAARTRSRARHAAPLRRLSRAQAPSAREPDRASAARGCVMRPRTAAAWTATATPTGGASRPAARARAGRDCLRLPQRRGVPAVALRSRDCTTQTAFPLEGAHRATPCVACHAELKAPPAPSTLAAAAKGARPLHFDESRSACTDCHADPHGDQFAKRRDKGACEGCHDRGSLRPRRALRPRPRLAFRLEGAHARVACAGCHRPEKRGDSTYVALQGRADALRGLPHGGRLTPQDHVVP